MWGSGCTENSTPHRPLRPAPGFDRPEPRTPARSDPAPRITVFPRRTGDRRMDALIQDYYLAVTAKGAEKKLWASLEQRMSAPHQYPVTTHSQVHFATHNKRKITMDIFVPQKTTGKPPLLVYFPGGGFVMYLMGFPSGALISGQNGYATAFVFYQLSTSSSGQFPAGSRSWPQALISGKQALRFLRDNASKYGYDASKIVVGGFSAGGAIASYLAATSGQNLLEPGSTSDPKTAVHGVWIASPVTNLAYFDYNDPRTAARKAKWGKLFWAVTYYLGQWADTQQAQWAIKQASPLGHLGAPASKIYWLISHGDADTVVPFDQSTTIYNKLRSLGAPARLYRHKGEGHHLSTVRLDRLVHIMNLVHGK